MKLYVCYGSFPAPRPGGHPCKNESNAIVAWAKAHPASGAAAAA
jgi:hypothetical protein